MTSELLRYQISTSDLPLAVCRELVAHLGQVIGVEVGLIPQTGGQFDYNQSQVSGLWIQHPDRFDPVAREQVRQILAYYQIQLEVHQP